MDRRNAKTTWTSDELDRIGAADELEISPRRPDGTLRRPVPIWVARVGDDLVDGITDAEARSTTFRLVPRAS